MQIVNDIDAPTHRENMMIVEGEEAMVDNNVNVLPSIHCGDEEQEENKCEKHSNEKRDIASSTPVDSGNKSETSTIIRLSRFTIDKNGISLIQDELSVRGIEFDESLGIWALKTLLTRVALNGEKEFQPKSSLIIQAIKDELI